MFDFKAEAELAHVNVRAENHGDEFARAIDIKFAADGVPIERVSSVCENPIERLYDSKGERVLMEFYPLKAAHKIENVSCDIKVGRSTVKLIDCDVAKVQLVPQPEHLCDVVFTVQTSAIKDGAIDTITKALREQVTVTMKERQGKLHLVENE